MFFLSKVLQFFGLCIILLEVAFNFPKLMNPQMFFFAIGLFLFGWLLEKYGLRN